MKKKIKKEKSGHSFRAEDENLTKKHEDDQTEDFSIKEFIKIKKLQNQVLEKMIEKLGNQDPKETIKKRKNK